jgi:hypothetical protein
LNCDEKYVRGHNRTCAKLFHIEIHDADEDDPEIELSEEPRISLLTIVGVRTRDTMQVVVRFGAVTVHTLLDSGSTHNFVSTPVTANCGLCFILCTNINVTIANGDKAPAVGVFRDATFTIAGEAFCADFFVPPPRWLRYGARDRLVGHAGVDSLGFRTPHHVVLAPQPSCALAQCQQVGCATTSHLLYRGYQRDARPPAH